MELDPRDKARIAVILVVIGILMSPEVLTLSAIRAIRDNAIAISDRTKLSE